MPRFVSSLTVRLMRYTNPDSAGTARLPISTSGLSRAANATDSVPRRCITSWLQTIRTRVWRSVVGDASTPHQPAGITGVSDPITSNRASMELKRLLDSSMVLAQGVTGMKRLAFALLLAITVAGGCGPGGIVDLLNPPVEPPIVESFSASPLTIAPGGSSTLTWAVSGATTVRISEGIGSVALTGSRSVAPATSTVYTLTATNSAGKSVTATAQVTVSGEPSSPTAGLPGISSFTANPPGISAGDTSNLSWVVSNATSVSINQGIGTVASVGNTSVSPSATTTYTLTAVNATGSATAEARVTVSPTIPAGPPVIEYFVASPPSIHPGQTSVLSWEVTGATSVVLDRGIGAVDAVGTRSVSVLGTTNYTLTASNSGGHVTMTIPVLVTDWPSPGDERPDLVITAIGKVASASGYVIGYTVKNQGDAASPATVSKLYAGGVLRATDSVPPLPAGSSVERQFSTWTYDPVASVIRVVADANGTAIESDESNNEKQVSIAVETVVNYIDTAGLAVWESGTPSTGLSFGGSLSDANGFACHRTSVKLEDGATYAKVLETHPKWVGNGWIAGYYPQMTIPLGARFVADVGFLDGAAGTDGVTFRVWFWQLGSDLPSLLSTKSASYNGQLDNFDIDLASIVGKTGNIGLEVLAGPSSGKDWAVWVNARMIR